MAGRVETGRVETGRVEAGTWLGRQEGDGERDGRGKGDWGGWGDFNLKMTLYIYSTSRNRSRFNRYNCFLYGRNSEHTLA